MKVKRESEVDQSCPTLSDPMDCGLPGSSVHGIFQARVQEWGATAFSVTGYYAAINMNKLLTYATTWLNLKGIMVSGRSQSEEATYRIIPAI